MGRTKIIHIRKEDPQGGYLDEAVSVIKRGGLVIIPTETVYGIAANALDKKAIENLQRVKQRPADKPFPLLVGSQDKVESLASRIPVNAYKLMERFWPGPLTVVLKSVLSGTIGLRMPDNQIALRILELSDLPLACPSANISGRPAPTVFSDAIKDLDGVIDMAIDAEETLLGIESTVVDLTVDPLKILREGAINKAELEEAVKKRVLFVCTGNSCRSVIAEALLKKELGKSLRDDVTVLSAGTMMNSGLTATEEVKSLLAAEAYDVSGHRSRYAGGFLLKSADIILVMEKRHEEKILQMAPEIKNRVFLLKEFAKIDDGNTDVADPIGRSMEFYEKTFTIIKDAVERIARVI